MPSTIAWIDYDSEANQRAQRILTLFREKDTRDELGFGPIRDAISDTLFPGTSVIHTRLRYMLFLPWIYSDLESRGVPSLRIAERARGYQLLLGEALLNNVSEEYGIIGREIKEGLKTLPASIYWAGLGAWGLRTYPGTVGQYHQALDNIYSRRKRSNSRRSTAADEGDDLGGLWERGNHTWHPGIPKVPEQFPNCATFDLTRGEAHYLQERVRHTHPDSLLSHLMFNSHQVSVSAPWEHPDMADFGKEHQDLLYHAHNFSLIAYGAAILYNIMLAELMHRENILEEYKQLRRQWSERFDGRVLDLEEWGTDLSTFWTVVSNKGHQIGLRTTVFVDKWVRLLLTHRESIFDQKDARTLIRGREIEKKGGNSRFTNERMQDQWRGSSGLTRMNYRWNIVQGYINDLDRALKG